MLITIFFLYGILYAVQRVVPMFKWKENEEPIEIPFPANSIDDVKPHFKLEFLLTFIDIFWIVFGSIYLSPQRDLFVALLSILVLQIVMHFSVGGRIPKLGFFSFQLIKIALAVAITYFHFR